jgi:hypothetical protein
MRTAVSNPLDVASRKQDVDHQRDAPADTPAAAAGHLAAFESPPQVG